MPRLPKGAVGYRMMKVLEERCGLCKWFVGEYGDIDGDNDDATICQLVAGQIVADAVCKLFTPIDLKDYMNGQYQDQSVPQAWMPPSQSSLAPMDMPTLYPATSGDRDDRYLSVNKDGGGFRIAKIDAAEQLVFGWASVSANADGDLIADHHNDVIEPAELEKAAYEYVLKFGDTGVMHSGESVGKLVESLVLTPDKARAMGITSPMHTAWWCGFKLDDAEVFDKVRSGEYPMFSIQGTAVPEDFEKGKGCDDDEDDDADDDEDA